MYLSSFLSASFLGVGFGCNWVCKISINPWYCQAVLIKTVTQCNITCFSKMSVFQDKSKICWNNNLNINWALKRAWPKPKYLSYDHRTRSFINSLHNRRKWVAALWTMQMNVCVHLWVYTTNDKYGTVIICIWCRKWLWIPKQWNQTQIEWSVLAEKVTAVFVLTVSSYWHLSFEFLWKEGLPILKVW